MPSLPGAFRCGVRFGRDTLFSGQEQRNLGLGARAIVASNDHQRIVPDIKSERLDDSRAFYVDFLGLKVGMDLGWIVTFVSPSNPTAQISVMRDDDPSTLMPNVSIEVADVDEVHARAIERGLQIVYPLTDEPWGIRRFFVVDPNGVIVNVSSHVQR